MNNMSKLVEIWNDWITANNLPSQARSMSASELLWEEYINEDQERFINAFLEMWESMSVYTSSWDQSVSPKKVQPRKACWAFFYLQGEQLFAINSRRQK